MAPPALEAFDLFVFDLDGTLADTRQDLAASVNAVLLSLGREALDLDTVTGFVGDGARVLLARALGGNPPPELLDAACGRFLEEYSRACLHATRLYPGVAETLEDLGRLEKDLAVLTNKPQWHSQRILEGLGIAHRFREVVGGDRAPAKKPDPRGLRELVARLGHSPARTLFVGDSLTDLRTASAAGIRMAYVTYGFRPDDHRRSDHQRGAPDFVLASFSEITDSRG
jgi:phosphoglycolate phosphatase